MERGLRQDIKHFLPNSLISRGRKWRALFNVIREFNGKHPRQCPICGYSGFFFADGQPLLMDSVCPQCRAIGRHRQHFLLMQRHPEWIDGKVVLHIAPEPCFIEDYRARAKTYLRGDFSPEGNEIAVDIQRMNFADETIDTIICHNVIEHVPDDNSALAEMFRVLRPGGVALLSAPVIEAWDETYENPKVKDYWECDLHFNQWDHVRYYGKDVRQRIRRPGFELGFDVATEPQVSRYGLERGETIFIATRPRTAKSSAPHGSIANAAAVA